MSRIKKDNTITITKFVIFITTMVIGGILIIAGQEKGEVAYIHIGKIISYISGFFISLFIVSIILRWIFRIDEIAEYLEGIRETSISLKKEVLENTIINEKIKDELHAQTILLDHIDRKK